MVQGRGATRRPATILGVEPNVEPVRVDRWLWAARFFKSRSLAAEAVKGGRVQVDGRRIKPGSTVTVDDRVGLTIGQAGVEVIVRGLSVRRGPAKDAAQLYEETPASRQERERRAVERTARGDGSAPGGSRPTKRDRRRLDNAAGRRRAR